MMRKVITTFVPLFIFISTDAIAQVQSSTRKIDFGSLSLEAEHIIKFHCGHCHTPNLKTTNLKALKVFNFSENPWYKKMNIRQLEKSVKMLAERRELTEAELKETFIGRKESPRKPTHIEIKTYKTFIEVIKEKKTNPLSL